MQSFWCGLTWYDEFAAGLEAAANRDDGVAGHAGGEDRVRLLGLRLRQPELCEFLLHQERDRAAVDGRAAQSLVQSHAAQFLQQFTIAQSAHQALSTGRQNRQNSHQKVSVKAKQKVSHIGYQYSC